MSEFFTDLYALKGRAPRALELNKLGSNQDLAKGFIQPLYSFARSSGNQVLSLPVTGVSDFILFDTSVVDTSSLYNGVGDNIFTIPSTAKYVRAVYNLEFSALIDVEFFIKSLDTSRNFGAGTGNDNKRVNFDTGWQEASALTSLNVGLELDAPPSSSITISTGVSTWAFIQII